MPRRSEKLVSVIGSGYFEPIADLVDHLLRAKRQPANRVKVNSYENGYAASAVLLLIAMFKSYASRVRYVQKELVPTGTRDALGVVSSPYMDASPIASTHRAERGRVITSLHPACWCAHWHWPR